MNLQKKNYLQIKKSFKQGHNFYFKYKKKTQKNHY